MIDLLQHTPVLLDSVIAVLAPKKGETALDVTLGLGGHARAFLEHVGPSGSLTGLDADAENLTFAWERLREWAAQTTLHHLNFRDLSSLNLPPVDVVFADLGLSSPHIDDPHRGFTFREDAPLDLRFDRTQGQTVAEWLHRVTVKEVSRVLKEYGELKGASKLAQSLKDHEPKTTFEVVDAVKEAAGWRTPSVLPQVFQALRIVVNEEMEALDFLLEVAPALLKPGGRFGVLSYHSLEDRRVKQAFRTLTTPVKNEMTGAVDREAPFNLLTKKAIVPSSEEIKKNQRARSAKFRAIVRTYSLS
ncbi:MAG: 16S rRNA (cytosine(1402)-N(4))-methyltransferase RsmH [Candidatus Peribacteraceae bacterium]|nr:16S rRNA (cytosine(1402)-N(4))-methyltransferase RsmH [Candidatus Peribacteraceae bacterium]